MAISSTAVTPGAGGNAINVILTGGPAISAGLAVTSVVGTTINIQLATDGVGTVTSTEANLVALMLGNGAITALLTGIATNSPAAVIPNFTGTQQFFAMNGSGGTGGGYAGLDPGNFKILLLDTNQIQISNVPLLWSNLIHVPQTAPTLTTTAHSVSVPENFWPTPPMMYRVNSSIRFQIYVTSATPLGAGSTWDFTFSGVRRYNCK